MIDISNENDPICMNIDYASIVNTYNYNIVIVLNKCVRDRVVGKFYN